MNYSNLVSEGLLKPFRASQTQIKDRIKLAERDIKIAQKVSSEDRDWSFTITYNAILQATRALMFVEGYRPTGGEGQHIAAVRFAEAALEGELGKEIYLFEKMRAKRHKVVYDIVGLVSEKEAEQALDFAQRFINAVKRRLKYTI